MLAPDVEMRVLMSELFLLVMLVPLMAEILSLLCKRPSHLSAGLSVTMRVISAPPVPNEHQTKPNSLCTLKLQLIFGFSSNNPDNVDEDDQYK